MEKLCSLCAIGELTVSEKRELDAHLAECAECNAMLRDFEHIALLDLPAIAAERTYETPLPELRLQYPEQILAKILNPSDKQIEDVNHIYEDEPDESFQSVPVQSRRWSLVLGPARWPLGWAVACVVIVAAGYFAMQARRPAIPLKPDLSAALQQAQSEAQEWKQRAEQTESQERLSAHQLETSVGQKAEAVATLETLRVSYSGLQQRQKLLEQQLADESGKLAEKESDLQSTRTSLEQERQQVKLLDTELQTASAKAAEARDRIAHFSQVSEKFSTPTAAPEPRVTDAEARQIFGARDLHIVDVYDVDRSGKTRRTYGRVYYVNHSLLLFYAFDLEDRKHNRKAAGFQAWGFREPNSSKPENLGLFYVDDASLNRWVLRVSDASVLSRIDTVFVTLEPPQGSDSPRGPKLLFASLGGPANHP